jgi:hypothetical protein
MQLQLSVTASGRLGSLCGRLPIVLLLRPQDAAPLLVIGDRHSALDAHANALAGLGFPGEELLPQRHRSSSMGPAGVRCGRRRYFPTATYLAPYWFTGVKPCRVRDSGFGIRDSFSRYFNEPRGRAPEASELVQVLRSSFVKPNPDTRTPIICSDGPTRRRVGFCHGSFMMKIP